MLTTLPLKEIASFRLFFDAVTGCVPFINDFSSVFSRGCVSDVSDAYVSGQSSEPFLDCVCF